MKQIRQGVFETNSSSTHSICIAKDVKLSIPKNIHFSFGEFGWERDTLSSIQEKASYLYTGMMYINPQGMDKIIETLQKNGVEVTREMPIMVTYKSGIDYIDNGGYVDHAGCLAPFLTAILESEERLLSFLFSDLSFIITGNDNDDCDVDINVKYPYEEFYKGN
jgi:hypothetical protein